MIRQVIFDTETTGFEPLEGHKVIEIACLETIDYIPSGIKYHTYVNPMREVPEEAYKVHGLSYEFLKDKELFSTIAKDFLDFVADSQLVAHNSDFDRKFINYELKNAGFKELPNSQFIDTLLIAKSKFPSPNTLDALCKRFGIDISKRDKHSAMLDVELLAKVYLELLGGAQHGLDGLEVKKNKSTLANKKVLIEARNFEIPIDDFKNHEEFVSKMPFSIWKS